MQEFDACPYCDDDLEQWSIRFHRGDREPSLSRMGTWGEERRGRHDDRQGAGPATVGADGDGLTLLSLCPSDRCGYYVLRYRTGLMRWDRDVEAARLLRTVFGDE